MTCLAAHDGHVCGPRTCRPAIAAMCERVEQRRRERSEVAEFVIWPDSRLWVAEREAVGV